MKLLGSTTSRFCKRKRSEIVTVYAEPIFRLYIFFIYFLTFYDIIPLFRAGGIMKEIIALVCLSIYTILQLIACIPQIVKILRTKRADDLSLMSWLFWITTDLSYLGYVLLKSPEIGVIFIAMLDLVSNMTVFILTAYYQKHNKRRKSCR